MGLFSVGLFTTKVQKNRPRAVELCILYRNGIERGDERVDSYLKDRDLGTCHGCMVASI